MQHDELVYLGHTPDRAGKAVRMVTAVSRAQFDRNEQLRLALLHLLQIIGEAARRVSDETKAAHPEIGWHRIIVMRHRIVHDYPDVDEDIVWDTATQCRPVFIGQLLPLIPPHLRERPKG